MATCKTLKLLVDLEVSSVTCPGVWLPNKGEVLVRLWILDETARTTSVLPVFPLVFHESFAFEKTFDCQRLPELHRLLTKEVVRAELQQVRSGRITALATFECSLLTLLYPEVDRPGLLCSEDVSLCMQPLFHFPGVLPPKLEILTRTIIQEELRGTRRKTCVNKTISSEAVHVPRSETNDRSFRNVRQLARQAHSLRTPSPPRTRGRCLERRPPFVVRHVEPDIFKLPSSPRSMGSSSPRSCRSSDCDCGQELTERKRSVSPRIQRIYTEQCCACNNKHARLVDDATYCHDPTPMREYKRHKESICTVCQLYRAYFGTRYPQHRHSSPQNCRTCGCSRKWEVRQAWSAQPLQEESSSEFENLSLSEWCRKKKNLRCRIQDVRTYDSHASYTK